MPPTVLRRDSATRCGIDTVEIARIERLVAGNDRRTLLRLFSTRELVDSGEGPGRAASLAARFAAKEACVKLFPREAALGEIEPADFSVARDAYGAPEALVSARAAAVLARNGVRAITLSLTHDRTSASAVALALSRSATPSLAGRLILRLWYRARRRWMRASRSARPPQSTPLS
jgi:holo-[acyl-carrier protein] synthase